MTPVSAVIITFNEAANIARCLESLMNLTDEIVVVDSFSTDDTPNICRSYGVQFLQREWAGYAATKNWANGQTQHQYILSVDADEVIDEELARDIQHRRSTGLEGVYSVNRRTNYCGHWVRYCGWYPDRKIRLFPKDKCHWEGDFVHETLVHDNDLNERSLHGHLLHYSYHSLDDHRSRAEKYAGLHAQKMAAQNRSSSSLKAYFSAGWKFIQVYLLKLGLLDGKAGWNIARFSAWAVFLKHRKLIETQAQKRA